MPSDISEELAVTKNDIKHLETDITEIKTGIKEINDNFSKHIGQMDEKYVRKEDFKEHSHSVEKRFDNMKAINYSLIGSVITGLILLVVNLIMGHIK